jgi:hypothetical protein
MEGDLGDSLAEMATWHIYKWPLGPCTGRLHFCTIVYKRRRSGVAIRANLPRGRGAKPMGLLKKRVGSRATERRWSHYYTSPGGSTL